MKFSWLLMVPLNSRLNQAAVNHRGFIEFPRLFKVISRGVEFHYCWFFWNIQIFILLNLTTAHIRSVISSRPHGSREVTSVWLCLLAFNFLKPLLSLICKMRRMIFTYEIIVNVKWDNLCKICGTVRTQQKLNKLLSLNLNGKHRRACLTFNKCKGRFTQPLRAGSLRISGEMVRYCPQILY